MALRATQKGMKKVRCSRFSVVPFSNLIRLRRMNTERIFVGAPLVFLGWEKLLDTEGSIAR